MYREIVDLRTERDGEVAAHFGLPAATTLLSRTYVPHQRGRPIGMITEKFPIGRFRADRHQAPASDTRVDPDASRARASACVCGGTAGFATAAMRPLRTADSPRT